MKIKTANLGYPRIGKNREVKKALEAFWNRNDDQNQTKFDANKLTVTCHKKDQIASTYWQVTYKSTMSKYHRTYAQAM
ncbi:MAG: hypothetical protein QNJ51_26325 [Calothrix sp. MO_167.B12]|nr:hypothetical protein [Calothrix sp. MO_167.B12]